MRLASGVLGKVLTQLLLPATKVYPQMRKSHTWIRNIANSLKSIYVKKTIRRKRNKRWELPCILQSGSSYKFVGGVLSHAGMQSPPLCLVTRHNLPALYSVYCLEDHSWFPSFIFRNFLHSKCRKIVSADKTERWSLHATNEVVKMTQIEDCKANLTFHFFSFLWSSWRKCSSSCWQYS